MNDGRMASDYTQTYTTFSGCDIVAGFGDAVIGELQAITYSISREKAPVYTMGSAEPRSFSRGKRGIAGTLVFTVFDRDALIAEMKRQGYKINKIGASISSGEGEGDLTQDPVTIDEWDSAMTGAMAGITDPAARAEAIAPETDPEYADEVPPFDITITFANEYGQAASLVVYGVEVLNEGTGFSIDSVTTEKACTFVARKVDYMRPAGESAGESAPEIT